jgi:hypothetical protein
VNKENGLKVFMVSDSDWYASPFEIDDFICWFRGHIDDSDDYETMESLIEECDLDKDCMWYETNSEEDIKALGDYDEQCKGGIGDLRRGIEDKRIIEKLMTFREVIKLQGKSSEPYLVATTNY